MRDEEMMELICTCNRCKKKINPHEAKRIVFEYSAPHEETIGSKFVELVKGFIPATPPRDYCPECVSEIQNFMKSKEGKPDESSI